MARTLFFCMVFRKSSEITKNKPIFSQYNILYNNEYLFFQSAFFDLFSIIATEINQIRNNVVCVVAGLVFLFCCALTTGRCNAFQHNFVNVMTMLFLVTMVKYSICSSLDFEYRLWVIIFTQERVLNFVHNLLFLLVSCCWIWTSKCLLCLTLSIYKRWNNMVPQLLTDVKKF